MNSCGSFVTGTISKISFSNYVVCDESFTLMLSSVLAQPVRIGFPSLDSLRTVEEVDFFVEI